MSGTFLSCYLLFWHYSYSYDLLGRRISKTEYWYWTYSTKSFVWDGAHIIAEYRDGSLTRKYIYGPGMDNPVAMINVDASQNETWYYYYADALGSIRLMTDGGGTPVESYSYDVYGKPRVMTSAGADNNWLTEDVTTQGYSSIGNPYLFTARRWDGVTELYYYRFRDYAPELGRFVQTDPIGYADGMNMYAYCGNNPLNWIDPWGLKTIIGIHSNGTHAWITVTDTDTGQGDSYGLWHHTRAGKGETAIRDDLYKNKERKYPHSGASRYTEINGKQEKRLNDYNNNKGDVSYRYPTNNCASYATDGYEYVTGEEIDSDSWIGLEMPEELKENIEELESEDPTSQFSPKGSGGDDSSSSSS